MRLAAFVPSRRALLVGAGALAFLAAFAWLVATRGPFAPVGVETATAARADLAPAVSGIGTVEAREPYAVGPIQAGRVLSVRVDQGDRVSMGQVLAEMDPVDLDARAEAAASAAARARQTAAAAQAQVAEAASRAALAQANVARYEALLQQNFVAREMVEQRRHEAAAADAALAGARASAAAATRDVARADSEQQALARSRAVLTLLSPVDGVVIARDAEPGTTLVAGQAALRLADPARLWVRARVDQARAAGVTLGQGADIALRSRRGTTLPGKVARIELQSDAVTEERIVNVAFDPPPAELYLGELAEVRIHLPGAGDVLAVPRAALVQHRGQTGVWRVTEGRARFQPVRIGVTSDDHAEIVDGLAAGDAFVVYSAKQLDDGARVRAAR